MHREGHTTRTTDSKVLEHSATSDEDIVLQAQRDPGRTDDCMALLYERHGARVTAWCRRLCRSADLAEDAAQEVFLKVQQRLQTFRGGSRFTTWLYVIARNSTLDFLAAKRNQSADTGLDDLAAEPESTAPDPTSNLADRDLQHRLRQAIQTELRKDEAQVVVLHCIHGLTLPAVTEIMGLENRSGAKALFVSAKRRLKAHFARELSELSQSRGRGSDG